jgi:Concanavalin A-like lectin/glucanases superfamily
VWDGNWHLVVGTFDGRTLRLYVDGVEIGAGTPFSGPIAYARTSSTDLDIGYYPAPDGCLAGGFTGSIDEPAIWNFALDAVQVGQLEPAGGSTSPVPGPGRRRSRLRPPRAAPGREPGTGPMRLGPHSAT